MCINCNLALPLKSEMIEKMGLTPPPDPNLDLLISTRSVIDLIMSNIEQNYQDRNSIFTAICRTSMNLSDQLEEFLSFIEKFGVVLFYKPLTIDSLEKIRDLLCLSNFDSIFKINLNEYNFWNERKWSLKTEFSFTSPDGYSISAGTLTKEQKGKVRLDIPPYYPKNLICLESTCITRAMFNLKPDYISRDKPNDIRPYLKFKSTMTPKEIWEGLCIDNKNIKVMSGRVQG